MEQYWRFRISCLNLQPKFFQLGLYTCESESGRDDGLQLLVMFGSSVIMNGAHNGKCAIHNVCVTAASKTISHTVHSFLLTRQDEHEYVHHQVNLNSKSSDADTLQLRSAFCQYQNCYVKRLLAFNSACSQHKIGTRLFNLTCEVINVPMYDVLCL